MGNYVGNNPNGVDLFMSDDYTSNSSKLIASTKCVYKAIQALTGNSIALNTISPMDIDNDTSWNTKFDNGLIIQSGIVNDNTEFVFEESFQTNTYMIINCEVQSQSKTGFVPDNVTKETRFLAIGF